MMESPSHGDENATVNHRNAVTLGQDPKPDLSSDVGARQMNGEQKVDMNDPLSTSVAVNRSKKSVHWSEDLVMERTMPPSASADHDDDDRTNPYVDHSPAPSNSSSFNFKGSMETVRDVLGRWGRKVGEATRKAEDLAGNTWQHLKTGPSLADAALGRIAQGTKVIAEGG